MVSIPHIIFENYLYLAISFFAFFKGGGISGWRMGWWWWNFSLIDVETLYNESSSYCWGHYYDKIWSELLSLDKHVLLCVCVCPCLSACTHLLVFECGFFLSHFWKQIAVTPADYEPPGFKASNFDTFLFQDEPVNIKLGDVATVSLWLVELNTVFKPALGGHRNA